MGLGLAAAVLTSCNEGARADGDRSSAFASFRDRDLATTELDRLLAVDGRLNFPADYREWVFLSAGHGMSYTPGSDSAEQLPFDNVFVDPASYRAFKRTGRWPEGTVFVLEIRPSRSQGSINRRGSFHHGDASAIEIHAKSRRFPTGWAFFSFDGTRPAEPIPTEADCYSCHQNNGAVDTTFVQFYPTMLPIARERNTLAKRFLESLEAK
jgi:hypothetical protein